MNKKCVECGKVVKWNKRSSLCEECYDEKLKIKIRDIDRVVNSPHSQWF